MPSGSSASPQRIVALVGRSNVGKSTLFNRLTGDRRAVVAATRGTTRDRLYGDTIWHGVPLTFVDTGGFEFAKADGLARLVQQHVQRAVEEAHALLFVCDAQQGLVPADLMIMDCLRKTGKPVVLAVNKADHHPMSGPAEFFSLGVPSFVPVSALSGLGTTALLERIVEQLPVSTVPQAPGADGLTSSAAAPVLRVAIVGRQNVGKSSLLNALLRQERAIVSPLPGTTRDAVETCLVAQGQPVALIDTAGLRHRRKVRNPVEAFSMSRTVEMINRCDVALAVLDGTRRATRDDRWIVSQICQRGRGLVVLCNKWDLVKPASQRGLTETVARLLPGAALAPVLAISAKTGFQVTRSLQEAARIGRVIRKGLAEPECLAMLRQAWSAFPPPCRGRSIHLERVRCLPGRPVHVTLTLRPAGWLPVPYRRYLLKQLCRHADLLGVPIQLAVQSR